MNNNVMIKRVILVIFLFLFQASYAVAVTTDLADIDALLKLPEEKIDIALAKLTIDKRIDPSIDVPHYLGKIDTMVSELKKMAGKKEVTVKMLNDYFFEPGPWNKGKPYSYNLDDPLGKQWDCCEIARPNSKKN